MSDEKIQQFLALSNASLDVAQTYLAQHPDLGDALDAFYAAQNGDSSVSEEQGFTQGSRETEPPRYKSPGPRESSSAIRKAPSSGPRRSGGSTSKFKSFSDILKENSQDEEDEQRNTFAGGETSGLEVADPNDSDSLIRDLLEKARRGGQRPASPDGEDSSAASQKQASFVGKGFRLGSSLDVPTEVVNDIAEERLPARPSKVTREITFWKEGFQINEGELYRYDDPANSYFLNELNQGRAPLKLLNVEFGQEVEVNVKKRLDESFKPPKRKIGGFHGKGHRLGSPILGESLSPEPVEEQTTAEDDEGKEESEKPEGDTSVQIRYATGKREVLRCNSTDTVRFLYDHVKSESGANRTFTLNHAFPVKVIDSYDCSLKDEGLCNAVVVQRWV
ncbi:LAME_0F10726g1_1 [Lachancea meyersii CBS 8951]|uniref:LAME_0F10726g1_1 n=1 Tax=Lachancea meyersii CBS 8951 TaxID=1266667 RepID=A0A1G4JVV1_9SACH|nr:LAME_0F10726g1_1 [Lachancea meyersii CBS 8951]